MQRTCFLYIVYTLDIQIVSYTLINIKSVYKINVLYVRYTLQSVRTAYTLQCVFTLAGPAHLARISKIMTRQTKTCVNVVKNDNVIMPLS